MDIKFALVTLILPAIMEISGLLMMLHPPKTRNVLFGYRTRRSLLSQETWDFANYYGGTLYVYLGFYITAATLLTDLVLKIIKADADEAAAAVIVLILLQALCFVFPLFFVEAKLKSHFDSEGRRIDSFSASSSSYDDSDWDDWNRDEWKEAWRDEYNDWELWKQKKDAEIAEKRRKQKAEETAELSIREEAGEGRRSGQRNPQGNRVNRRIYDRYRIYRGNCGAGFYGSVGCAPAEKSAGVSAGQIVFSHEKGEA